MKAQRQSNRRDRSRRVMKKTILAAAMIACGQASAMTGNEFKMYPFDGTEAFTVDGPTGTNLGYSVDARGDFNGDGVDDIVVSNPTRYDEVQGTYTQGAVQIIFGKRNTDPWRKTYYSNDIGYPKTMLLPGSANEAFGTSVSAAGDVNGDGIDDLLVGSVHTPNFGSTGTTFAVTSGFVYVLYGHGGEWPGIKRLEEMTSDGYKIIYVGENQILGNHVSAAGDVNNDGLDDILIGAPDVQRDGRQAGEAYVVYGSANPLQSGAFSGAFDLNGLNGTNGFTIVSDAPTRRLGWNVSRAGDFNNDGIDDLVVAAKEPDPDNEYSGEGIAQAMVLFGSQSIPEEVSSNAITSQGTVYARIGVTFSTTMSNGILEDITITDAGDFNNDGFDDIAIAPQNAQGDNTATIFFGKTVPSFGRVFFDKYELVGQNSFGAAMASAGDVNGDDMDDLIIGTPFAGDDVTVDALGTQVQGNTYVGEAHVIYGTYDIETNSGTGHIRRSVDGQHESYGFRVRGIKVSGLLGSSVGGGGDLNDDGLDDVVIGLPAPIGGISITGDAPTYAGEILTIFGSETKATDPKLVAHYRFNGLRFRGKNAANLPTGQAPDYSRFNNHLGSVNTGQMEVDEGEAVIIRPTTTSRLMRANTPSLEIRHHISIAATARLGANAFSSIVSKYSGLKVSGKYVPAYSLDVLPNGSVRFSWLMHNENTPRVCVTPTGRFTPTHDNRFIATRNSQTGIVTVSVNGSREKVCHSVTGPLRASPRQFVIGSYDAGMPRSTTRAMISDVRVYRRILSQSEIVQMPLHD